MSISWHCRHWRALLCHYGSPRKVMEVYLLLLLLYIYYYDCICLCAFMCVSCHFGFLCKFFHAIVSGLNGFVLMLPSMIQV